MNNAHLTVDGGRLMVCFNQVVDKEARVEGFMCIFSTDVQVAGVDDGIRLPDHYYTA